MFLLKNSLPLSEKRELFFRFALERIEKQELYNSVNFNNLTYHYKGRTTNVDFNDLVDAATLLQNIRSKKIKLVNTKKFN